MYYTYGVIRGEKELFEYCKLRWHDTPLFNGDFSHNLFDGYTERLYCKSPTDEGYYDYYIMAMADDKGQYCDPSKIREVVYNAVKEGTQKLVQIPIKR